MIYFTSDLHFWHKNIIQLANRPFQTIEEMNRTLIQTWNSCVRKQDEVYILGDVTLAGPEKAMDVLCQLNGRKYLVKGNHDGFADKDSFDNNLFEWVKDYHCLKYEKKCFILCHYPFEEWDGFFRNTIHLHGHQNNCKGYNLENKQKGLLRYDVGVDANRFRPVSIHEILQFFGKKKTENESVR